MNDESGQASINTLSRLKLTRESEGLMADGQIRPSIATRGIQLQLIAGKGRFGQSPAHSLATCSCWKIATKSTPVANKDPYFRVDPAFRGETHQKAREGVARNKGVSYSKRYELLCRRLVLARIIHECRREAAETEASHCTPHPRHAKTRPFPWASRT